jgi:hypothetical protein
VLTVCVLAFVGMRTPPLDAQFIRGDANCDGCVSLRDGYDIAALLFMGVPLPCACPDATDADDNGVVDVADSVYILAFVAAGGPAPPLPFPLCGVDPTPDGLACPGYPPCPLFKRGDADCDGCVSAMDATYLSAFLFMAGPPPCCMEAADANDDGLVTVADTIFILDYCTLGGPAPPAPGPFLCGGDPTPAGLGCILYPMAACCSGCLNQLPCDCNQDGALDISDAVCLLGFLFTGTPAMLPCGDGSGLHTSNLLLMSCNGDGVVDIADAIYLLIYLFGGGPPPVLGTTCIYIEVCPQNPACAVCTP